MLSIALGARLGLAYLLEGSLWSPFRLFNRHSAE
jgi:hypothetical protein